MARSIKKAGSWVEIARRGRNHRVTIARIKNLRGPWFHKQFHGFPLTLLTAGIGVLRYGHRLLPWAPAFGVCLFQKDIADWYWNVPELLRARQKTIARQLRDRTFIFRIDRARTQANRSFVRALQRFSQLDLRQLSNAELWRAYNRILEPCYLVWGWGGISEPFLGDQEDWLSQALQPELRRRFGESWRRQLTALAVTTFLSFANQEHRSLLRLAVAIRREPALRRAILRRDSRAFTLTMNHSRLRAMLARHTHLFYWIEDNYSISRQSDERTFFSRAALLTRQDPATKLRRELQREQLAGRYKRSLLKQISHRAQNLILLADTLASSSDQRKASSFQMARVWFGLVAEVARRHRLPQRELLYLLNDELKRFLIHGTLDRQELRRRVRRCLVILDAHGERVFSGRSIANMNIEIFEEIRTSSSQIRGVAASPGVARGVVRIVRKHPDIALVKRGEILVANNTTPDYIRAMRRAAAIVTEQGGITSHAAVVSRELGVPCVIGTRIATRVFKTGNLVEVDANNGIVRRLKS